MHLLYLLEFAIPGNWQGIIYIFKHEKWPNVEKLQVCGMKLTDKQKYCDIIWDVQTLLHVIKSLSQNRKKWQSKHKCQTKFLLKVEKNGKQKLKVWK